MAQVSMNLTNLDETPLHAAFDACDESANKRGLRVTGSEVVGMLPKKCLVDAGQHYFAKTEMVGRRVRRGADRSGDPLDGIK